MKSIAVAVAALMVQMGYAIHVEGNRLVDDHSGKTVILQGFSHSGTEFACVGGYGIFDGPNDDNSIQVMKQWNINVVRVPLNEHCWLGINGVNSKYGGQNYQNEIGAYVQRLLNHGIYVILDLHWTLNGNSELAKGQQPMPNMDHSVEFWTQCANYFKHQPNVLFDVFNEPYPDRMSWDDGWRCFRDGGNCGGISYQVAGMQHLVDAVRNTGARNVILIGGLAYSNDLSQWLQWKPNDSAGQLAASAHLYNFNWCNNRNCWEEQLQPISKQYPFIVGEFGQNDCAGWYVEQMADWYKQEGGLAHGHLAWTYNSWDCKNGPALITDYNGGCTDSFGCTVRKLFQSFPITLAHHTPHNETADFLE